MAKLLVSAGIGVLAIIGAGGRPWSLDGTRIGAKPFTVTTPAPLVAQGWLRYDDVSEDQTAYIPVTFQGHTGALVIGFGLDDGLALSRTALTKQGVTTLPPEVDSISIGTSVERHVAVQRVPFVPFLDPPGLPPIVGYMGNKFLPRYDIVVDGPALQIRLYARASGETSAPAVAHPAWIPTELGPMDCTPVIEMPGNNSGFAIHADGHPLTAILETASTYVKMNDVASQALGLSDSSPRVHPLPVEIWERGDFLGDPVKGQVTDVRLTLGQHAFSDGPINLFPHLDLDQYNTPIPPLILLNLHSVRHQILVISNSTGQVCLGGARAQPPAQLPARKRRRSLAP